MAQNNLQPSIKKNFFLNTLYEILCIITPFITAPYAARILGAANIGIYSYTSSIEMYFALVAVMGTEVYGKREISRTRADKELNSKLFWEIELLSIMTSVGALIFWGVFVFFSNSEYKIYYLILSIDILSKLFDVSWYYRGLEQFKYTVTRNSIVRILGVVCLFIFVRKPEDLWIYFLFHVGINFLGNISMWFTLPKFLTKVSIKELKILPHFKQTFIYFVPTIAASIYTVLDKTLIGVITKDPETNGYYEQASKLINVTRTICFSSLNAVLGSRTAYLFEQNKINEIKEKILISTKYIIHLSIPCCFGIIGIASIFVPIFYGEGYEAVIPLLQLLSPVLFINGFSNCLGSLYYIPAGFRNRSTLFLIIGSVVNLLLNIFLIPKLGATGAILGTLIAEGIITILYIRFCDGFLNFMDVFVNSWKPLLASATMYGIIFALGHSFPNLEDYILLIIEFIVGVIVYITVLLILKDDFILFMFKKFKDIIQRKINKNKQDNNQENK